MQIVLAAAGVPLPGAAAKHGLPVSGRRAIGLRVSPNVPVGFGIITTLATLFEPGMLIGSVRHDLIDGDF